MVYSNSASHGVVDAGKTSLALPAAVRITAAQLYADTYTVRGETFIGVRGKYRPRPGACQLIPLAVGTRS